MKKNILFYTDTTQVGGAEQHMFLLAKHINKEIFNVILACSISKNLDIWTKKFHKEGVSVIRLKVSHKHDPRHLIKLKKIIKDFDIDLLHAHVWNPASCRYAYLAAHSCKIPLIATEHDPFQLSSIKDWIKKYLNKNVTKVIAVSEANKRLIEKLYPYLKGKITVVHNAIDTTWFDSQLLSFSEKDKEQYRKETFKTTAESKVIICVGELHPRKGQEYLIKATELLKKHFPEIRVVLVGDGPSRENIKNLIKKLKLEDNVILLGHRHDIPQLLKSSDIFVLPSLKEAFGLAILEAMCVKIPVISTKSGGVPEIITNNENGIVVEPKDERALSNAIIRIIKNPQTGEKFNKKTTQTLEKFDIKVMVPKVEKIYNEATMSP